MDSGTDQPLPPCKFSFQCNSFQHLSQHIQTFRNTLFAMGSFQSFRVHLNFQLTKCSFLGCHIFITSSTQSEPLRTYWAVPSLHYCAAMSLLQAHSPIPVPNTLVSCPLSICTPTTPFRPRGNAVFFESCCYMVQKSPVLWVCVNLFLLTAKATVVTEKNTLNRSLYEAFSGVILETKGRVQRKQTLLLYPSQLQISSDSHCCYGALFLLLYYMVSHELPHLGQVQL